VRTVPKKKPDERGERSLSLKNEVEYRKATRERFPQREKELRRGEITMHFQGDWGGSSDLIIRGGEGGETMTGPKGSRWVKSDQEAQCLERRGNRENTTEMGGGDTLKKTDGYTKNYPERYGTRKKEGTHGIRY